MRTCQGPIDLFLDTDLPAKGSQFSLGTHLRRIETVHRERCAHPFVESLYLSDCIQIDSPRAPNCCVAIVSEE